MEPSNEESYNWYMVFTALYAEKRVKFELDKRGIANFLPLMDSKLLWRDKEINRTVPVIPHCIFIRLSPSEVEKLSDIPSLRLPLNLCDWQLSEQQMKNINLAFNNGDLSKVCSLVEEYNNLS